MNTDAPVLFDLCLSVFICGPVFLFAMFAVI